MKKIAFTLVILLLSACTLWVRADDFSLDSYLKASSEQPYDVGFWLQNASRPLPQDTHHAACMGAAG